MKITKKVTSLLLVLLLALSTCAAAITASAADMPAGPYHLNITKYVGDATSQNNAKIGNGNPGDPSGAQLQGEQLNTATAGFHTVQGVHFSVTFVGAVNSDAANAVTADNFKNCTKPADTNAWGAGEEIVTGAEGLAKFETDDPGLYYVEETQRPNNISKASVPFYVYLPMTNTTGDGWVTDVYAYPKNIEILGASKIQKFVEEKTYVTELKEQFIASGATFELHQVASYNTLTEKFTKADKTIATFNLASVSAAGALVPASVKSGNATAVSVDGEDISTETLGQAIAKTTYAATKASNGLADQAFTHLEAAVTNGGYIAVNGLPQGIYAWVEATGTTAYNRQVGSEKGDLTSSPHPLTNSNEDKTYFLVNKTLQSKADTEMESEGASFTAANSVDYASYDLTNYQFGESVAGGYALQINNGTVPTPTKQVKEHGGDEYVTGTTTASNRTYDLGEEVVYRIAVNLPATIAGQDDSKYVFEDTLPAGITLGDPKFKVYGKMGDDGEEHELDPSSYTDQSLGQTIKLQLDNTNIKNETTAFTWSDTSKTPYLVVYIYGSINENAQVTSNIDNTAKFSVDNDSQTSNTVRINTGGFRVAKQDSNTKALLSGAVFNVYRETDVQGGKLKEDAQPLKFTKDDGETSTYYYNGTNGKADITTSSAASTFNLAVKGLAYGTYYIVETKAPTGHQLVSGLIQVTVGAGTYTTQTAVLNPPTTDLPFTGGMGTIIFTVVGLALIGGAAFFFIRSRKSKKEEA